MQGRRSSASSLLPISHPGQCRPRARAEGSAGPGKEGRQMLAVSVGAHVARRGFSQCPGRVWDYVRASGANPMWNVTVAAATVRSLLQEEATTVVVAKTPSTAALPRATLKLRDEHVADGHWRRQQRSGWQLSPYGKLHGGRAYWGLWRAAFVPCRTARLQVCSSVMSAMLPPQALLPGANNAGLATVKLCVPGDCAYGYRRGPTKIIVRGALAFDEHIADLSNLDISTTLAEPWRMS
ncbi:hypothetical protein C8Q70DRAFT_930597 [Cubamyces menziesii]|nr:hypothetical protein C8Q70DRAFT_930597 [Cubamyces menziesii]